MMEFYKHKSVQQLAFSAFTAIGLFVFSHNASSQPYFKNEGAGLSISAGTSLNIDGGFINESGGSAVNNGTISVSGSWENNDAGGVFTTNAGTVILDGGAQTIGGTQTTKFNNLTLAGTASSLKTLDRNTIVGGGYASPTGVLTLHNGGISHTLVLNAKELEITNPANTAISIGAAGKIRSETTPSVTNSGPAGPGYGYVTWNIGQSGNGNTYTIPFATAAGVSIPFDYEKTSAGTGLTGKMRFATYPTADDNTPWATTITHMNNDYNQPSHLYVIDRFWIIEHTGYSSADMPKSKYIFTYDEADITGNPGITSENTLRPQRFNPFSTPPGWGDWLYGPDSRDNINNKIQISVANGFDGIDGGGDYLPVWTLVDESNPLPIELVRFTGVCNNGQVTLQWTTASETNNDYFTVQRSLDGTNFEDVTTVPGAGNSSSIINYTAVDYNPYGGTSYYRLKQTDFDGASKFSDVVAVNCANIASDFNLINAYDQNNGNMAVVFSAGDNELYTVTLYDARGRLLTETSGKAHSGKNYISIPIGDLARGIYLVNLKNEYKSFGRRVMLN